MLKKVIGALLCAAIMCNSGLAVISVNAANSGSSTSSSSVTLVRDKSVKCTSNKYIKLKAQYISFDINDSEKVKIIDSYEHESFQCDSELPTNLGEEFYVGDRVEGIVESTDIHMYFLQKLKFKPIAGDYMNSKYGKVTKSKVEVIEDGNTIKLSKLSNGYYEYDTSKPKLYKIKITFITDANNALYKYYTIDNRGFARKAWDSKNNTYNDLSFKYKTTTTINGKVYEDTEIDEGGIEGREVNYNSLANIFRLTMIPEGSKLTFLNGSVFKNNFDSAYYADFNDYKTNGMDANWTSFKGSKIFKAGEYAIMFRFKKDIGVAQRNIVAIPYMCVAKQSSVVDADVYNYLIKYANKDYKFRNSYVSYSDYVELMTKNNYVNEIGTEEYHKFVSLERFYDYDYLNDMHNPVDDNDRLLNFKHSINYKNMLDIMNIIGSEYKDNRYVGCLYDEEDARDAIFYNNGLNKMHTANIKGVSSYNVEDLKIYYVLGKDVDYNNAQYTLVKDKSIFDTVQSICEKHRDDLNENEDEVNNKYAWCTVKLKYKINGAWKSVVIKNIPVPWNW